MIPYNDMSIIEVGNRFDIDGKTDEDKSDKWSGDEINEEIDKEVDEYIWGRPVYWVSNITIVPIVYITMTVVCKVGGITVAENWEKKTYSSFLATKNLLKNHVCTNLIK